MRDAGKPEADEKELRTAVVASVAAADAGRLAPYEAVRRWILSWGSDNELKPPSCK